MKSGLKLLVFGYNVVTLILRLQCVDKRYFIGL